MGISEAAFQKKKMLVRYQYCLRLLRKKARGVLIADLRHFLARDLSFVKLPAPAMRLRDYLGAIVEAATSRNRKETDYVTQVKCHRRPKHRRYEGNIIVYFPEDEPSAIKWGCSFCGESGYIRGWQRTVWDKTPIT